MTQAFPLKWPTGRPRTPAWQRRGGANFQRSLKDSTDFLLEQIRKMGGEHVVVSSNMQMHMNGRASMQGDDNGVAIYFQLDGKPMVFANDSYDDLKHNVNAIALTIEALRGIERWGSRQTMTQAFSGFAALPPPVETLNWRKQFAAWGFADLPLNATLIDAAYNKLAREFHPDRPGGSNEKMALLNEARDAARKEIA